MAESLVNGIVGARAGDACADGDRRDGYRERPPVASVGTTGPRTPKPRRGTYFPDDPLARCSRVDRAAAAAVSEMVAGGVPAGKAARAASAPGADRMGAGRVSRACGSPIRMPGAVFTEMDGEWASRRRFTGDSIARAYGKDAGAPAASCTGTPGGMPSASSSPWRRIIR